MDKDRLNIIAQEAIVETGSDCEVNAVFELQDGHGWCINFSNGYGQFCHEYPDDESARDYTDQMAREEIKQYLRRTRE